MVSFTPEVINGYYNLPDIEDDDYKQYLLEDLDYNDIVKRM